MLNAHCDRPSHKQNIELLEHYQLTRCRLSHCIKYMSVKYKSNRSTGIEELRPSTVLYFFTGEPNIKITFPQRCHSPKNGVICVTQTFPVTSINRMGPAVFCVPMELLFTSSQVLRKWLNQVSNIFHQYNIGAWDILSY